MYTESQIPGSEEPVHCFHWGHKRTIFQFTDFVPIIFRMDGVSIGESQLRLPKADDK